jgi:hypothetical protein
MKNIIYLFSVLFLLFCLFQPKISLADTFVVNLIYNQSTDTLSLDNAGVTINKNVDVPFSDIENPSTIGVDKLILLEDKGVQAFAWQFNPQNGPFSINLPYVSIAKSLEIVDSASNKVILQTDLSKYSTCNANGICEFDKGENIYTCAVDCAAGKTIKYDPATLKLLKSGNGAIKDSASGEILLRQTAPVSNNNYLIYIIAIAGGIIAIGLIIWLVIRRRK